MNNGINGLSGLNAYTSNMNNVAALNAMTSMAVNGNTLNGLNLQSLNQGGTGFTPTFEGDRSLGNGMNNLSTNDFVGWPVNFAGIISDAASATYPQQNSAGSGNLVTNNGAANQVNTSFGGINISFPNPSNKLLQGGTGGGLSNSTSPTSAALSGMTSLSGQQQNFFNIPNHQHHQLNTGNGGAAAGGGGGNTGIGNMFDQLQQQQQQQQMRHDDLDGLKIIPTSGLMMRSTNVNVGN